MAPAPPDELAKQPAHPGAHLKPGVGRAAWMDGADEVDGADRLDRLAADFALVTTLAFQQFTGPDYDYFERELAKYGLAVISAWIRRDVILQRCRVRGAGGLEPPPPGAFDDPGLVEDLAQETVGVALVHFRDDVLAAGRWDYRRGASLRTFFIGQCLMRFPNIYRHWRRHDATDARSMYDADPPQHLLRPDPGPEQMVIDQEYGQYLLGQMSRRDAKIFQLLADGLKQSEIAEQLGITTKTVERAVANQRTRMGRRA